MYTKYYYWVMDGTLWVCVIVFQFRSINSSNLPIPSAISQNTVPIGCYHQMLIKILPLKLMIITLNFYQEIFNGEHFLSVHKRDTLSLFLSHSFIKLSIIVKILLISLFNKRSFQQRSYLFELYFLNNFPSFFSHFSYFISIGDSPFHT